ncbi:hypothetical protein TNIN_81911 [Trichonephila inaurata madagascariensis]|uniref:Uncharacterized protein n=1 Tax=Trichonephila inaurata madagascariensis TaxID=2747483 RepID=A0A8X7CIQ4_9ARAC|nr:hypothetical protein TNIN_81911 [Trichonephila inaurata madagascariensis]
MIHLNSLVLFLSKRCENTYGENNRKTCVCGTVDPTFDQILEGKEKAAWEALKSVVRGFLGSKKDKNYRQLLKELLQNFHDIGCNMFLKIHPNVLREKLKAESEDSLQVDKESDFALKQMAAILLIAAERYFEERDFTKLYQTSMLAFGLCPSGFTSAEAMETFKVIRYIYEMTRDPDFVFPLAPTHQRILRRFFRKEGRAWSKYVLPPDDDDDDDEETSISQPWGLMALVSSLAALTCKIMGSRHDTTKDCLSG